MKQRRILTRSTDPCPSSEGALCLFFGGLPPILAGRLPPNSPIASSLIQSLRNIGRVHIQNQGAQQRRLLHSILTHASAANKTENPFPQNHPEPGPSHSSLGLQIGIGSPQPAAPIRKFTETRATLFDLFTPNCLLKQDIGPP